MITVSAKPWPTIGEVLLTSQFCRSPSQRIAPSPNVANPPTIYLLKVNLTAAWNPRGALRICAISALEMPALNESRAVTDIAMRTNAIGSVFIVIRRA